MRRWDRNSRYAAIFGVLGRTLRVRGRCKRGRWGSLHELNGCVTGALPQNSCTESPVPAVEPEVRKAGMRPNSGQNFSKKTFFSKKALTFLKHYYKLLYKETFLLKET
jgi:hypothetical protein